ncbi:MAG: hypothetical protein VYD90_13030 [Pseudomonadota bacterium]|nr:hypothetical protein [Pseudomonadota bacterium]
MITPREQRIVDLFEAGLSQKAIAERMGLAESYVRGRVAYLCSNLGPDVRHALAMRQGSQALLDRIEQARMLG